MKRSAPMKRTAFKSANWGATSMDPERDRQRQDEKNRKMRALLETVGRPATMGGTTTGPVPKEAASQSSAYQVAVRALGYCMRCGCTLRVGERQFCHADEGKGIGIKTDVRRGWLGCAGCHFHVGASGRMPRALRRLAEKYLAWKTRCALRRFGAWPKSLPDTWRALDEVMVKNPEARP